MKFFALDCHIGIEDLRTVFFELGHELVVHSLSSHAHIMGWDVCRDFIVNENNWRNLGESNCNLFYETHKNELSSYDGFVCFYPPSFSMMYESFEKPIITHVPIRFEVPFQHRKHDLAAFISHLRRTTQSGQLKSLANNRFDAAYCTSIVGSEFKLIPSLCDYSKIKRSGSRKDVVLYTDPSGVVPETKGIVKLGKGYKSEELYSCQAAVHIPYHNSTMSLFEQYTANMPILIPSDNFMMKLWEKNHASVLSQKSWLEIDNRAPEKLYSIPDELDINLYDRDFVVKNFIKLSDWNDKEWMPHIIRFDDWNHLQRLVENHDFDLVSEKMKSDSFSRKEKILSLWNNLIQDIK